MRIGYPCINLSLTCRASRTLRLASLSWERLRETVAGNLACLEEMVHWNAGRGLLFLRVTSDLIPFASHPENRFPWDQGFSEDLARIGALTRRYGMRISMHPGQYTVLNSPKEKTVAAAVADLAYHTRVLDRMGLDRTAKVQIHLGGQYGDKEAALERFIRAARGLDPAIRARLAVEHDERLYNLDDCLRVSEAVGIPVVLDVFHRQLNPDGRTLPEALEVVSATWTEADGIPIVDYSSPLPNGRVGSHAHTLDEADFRRFLEESRPHDFDLMLEVKDKERSALRALEIARTIADGRLIAQTHIEHRTAEESL